MFYLVYGGNFEIRLVSLLVVHGHNNEGSTVEKD